METKKSFVDYYQVLQVWPTASQEVIKQAYFKLARIYHPDVVSKTDDKERKDEIDFKMINEAFAVLSDSAKRREYDAELKKKEGVDPEQRDADKRSAQLAFQQAKTAMKHNRYDKAVILLKSAVKYDPSEAAHHSWYGFALAALKTNLHEARDACKKALEMEFYNAEYHANLGYVYHQAGLTSTARECFEEAIKWDPDNALARRHLQGKKGGKASKKGIFSFFRQGDDTPKKPKIKKR